MARRLQIPRLHPKSRVISCYARRASVRGELKSMIICTLLAMLYCTRTRMFHRTKSIAVLYVYVEEDTTNIIDMKVKRENLYYFTRTTVLDSHHAIQFYFMHTALPSTNDFFTSIHQPNEGFILPFTQHNVHNFTLTKSEANESRDLCKFARLLSFVSDDFVYYVMLNDGVRGPILPVRQLGSRSYTTITASGVPVWFEAFNKLLTGHPKMKFATQTLSCELAVHGQTYFMVSLTRSETIHRAAIQSNMWLCTSYRRNCVWRSTFDFLAHKWRLWRWCTGAVHRIEPKTRHNSTPRAYTAKLPESIGHVD